MRFESELEMEGGELMSTDISKINKMNGASSKYNIIYSNF